MIREELHEMIQRNRDARISHIETIPLEIEKGDYYYFFCGAVADGRGHIIGIPNKYPHVLEISPETDRIEQWGKVTLSASKGWTGGALASDGNIYGFPRGTSSILKINTEQRTVGELPLNRVYEKEHHYGGTITSDDIIYLPPKQADNILSFDVKLAKSKDIPLKSIIGKKFLFYGASVDLNDNVYFYPAGRWTRVAMIDSKGVASFIGRPLFNSFFNSGTLAQDGDMYGFSSYKRGILHINTKTKQTEVLEKRFHGGFFGAKLAFNGKIYGVPGNSDEVAVFDPWERKIVETVPLPSVEKGVKAKCAGAAIDRMGNIWCVPAMGHFIYKIVFTGIKMLPSAELFRSKYFASTY